MFSRFLYTPLPFFMKDLYRTAKFLCNVKEQNTECIQDNNKDIDGFLMSLKANLKNAAQY